MWIKILIVRIAILNDKTNSYPPHKRTVTATENLSKAELKKAESKKRIAILNNNTNFYPPNNVHQLTMQSHPRQN